MLFFYRDILQRHHEDYVIRMDQIADEQARIDRAIEEVRQSLLIDAAEIDGKLDRQSGDIFRAQAMMLSSSSIRDELKRTLESALVNAEQVVMAVFRLRMRSFRELSDEILRERSDDLEDLSRRMLLAFAGIQAHSLETLPAGTVVAARRLLPSDTVFLSRHSTVAIITEFAGRAAHAALLARELGIPSVGGIPNLLAQLDTGEFALVDGDEGTVVVDPDEETRDAFERSIAQAATPRRKAFIAPRLAPAITRDGISIAVLANVGCREDVEHAMRCGADGIGLFRTETFFLAAKHLPSEADFAEFLVDSLEPTDGKPVDLRLLDLGADKSPLYLSLPSEPDPFLGRRGVRLLRKYPELLGAQLRAILEVSRRFPIRLLVPMVTTTADVSALRQSLVQAAGDLGATLPPLGAMVETPAAALSIVSLRDHVEFFSIGSNDLTQYTMAVGRENALVSEYFDDEHASILRLIRLVVAEAEEKPVSLCGELAGRLSAIPRILEAGVRALSVAPFLIDRVKEAIRATTVASLSDRQ